MSLLDTILGQAGGNLDVASIAAKIGIDPSMAQQAISALTAAHAQAGDTVETAAAQTGFDAGTLAQVAQQLGGASMLGKLSEMMQGNPQAASLLNMADRDGDGNPLNDLMGMAKGLFGRS